MCMCGVRVQFDRVRVWLGKCDVTEDDVHECVDECVGIGDHGWFSTPPDERWFTNKGGFPHLYMQGGFPHYEH